MTKPTETPVDVKPRSRDVTDGNQKAAARAMLRAVGLTDEYLPGGRFKHSVKISRFIGKVDCRKVSCAISVRADHLRSTDRTHDLFIPVTISK